MNQQQKQRVVVGMSGGVDSSVAALLLQREGHEVHGLFMFNWGEDEQGYCTAAEDFKDAKKVCDKLDIPLHTVNFAAEYRKQVFDVFLTGLSMGRTPNPDVLCNREIKFGNFLAHARRLGADQVATGHYVRRQDTDGQTRLLRGHDRHKDQSYFLHAVPEQALRHALFPVGELEKSTVRELALQSGLHNSRKRDSTGICFIGERPFREFLQQYLDTEPGDMIDVNGIIVGKHIGLPFYTLGQRQGLGIGGVAGSNSEPWYVAAKDADRNALVVVQGRDNPLLYANTLFAKELHWINGQPSMKEFACQVSTRYRQEPAAAIIHPQPDNACRIEFSEAQWAVTPGQYAVIYAGDHCLGGGVIVSGLSPGP
ncbi:MAG: tRNA 2-thiouridine(34) synthase MnmA [Gammaproteobacteria bacterium]|nr:tRNA 2-thiouridine(34) synthase MnmA [Gammaproteobacteria bacterium]